jgi:DNA-binding NarL/FixJ family response regulator
MNHFNSIKRRVIIVEDDKILRESFFHIVNNTDKFMAVGSYATAEQALQDLNRRRPDIVLMDIELPGLNGIEATSKIKSQSPRTEVIMVTVYEDNELVFNALKAGATGYITKSANYLEIATALDEIAKGGAPMSSKIAKMVIHNFHINPESPLSKREKEVLTLMSEGKTYSQISRLLGISPETSKSHIKNIYVKLHVNKKSDAIELANQQRLI